MKGLCAVLGISEMENILYPLLHFHNDTNIYKRCNGSVFKIRVWLSKFGKRLKNCSLYLALSFKTNFTNTLLPTVKAVVLYPVGQPLSPSNCPQLETTPRPTGFHLDACGEDYVHPAPWKVLSRWTIGAWTSRLSVIVSSHLCRVPSKNNSE